MSEELRIGDKFIIPGCPAHITGIENAKQVKIVSINPNPDQLPDCDYIGYLVLDGKGNPLGYNQATVRSHFVQLFCEEKKYGADWSDLQMLPWYEVHSTMDRNEIMLVTTGIVSDAMIEFLKSKKVWIQKVDSGVIEPDSLSNKDWDSIIIEGDGGSQNQVRVFIVNKYVYQTLTGKEFKKR